jgi:hypothetical protein
MLLTVPIIAVGLAFGIQGVVLASAIIGSLYFFIKRRTGPAFGIIGVFGFLSCLGVGNSVQVRVDTGDQRLCFWGIPASYRPMESESRKALLSLNDPQVPRRWVWCATKVGSNNADSMVYGFYYEAAAWVEVDPAIAKLVVRDLARYVQTTHATHGLPDCTSLIWPDVVDRRQPRAKVVEGWEKNQEVQAYLAARDYVRR